MPNPSQRTFAQKSAAGGGLPRLSLAGAIAPDPQPILRLETDPKRAAIPILSWDTEGGDRSRTNLLRSPGIGLRLRPEGVWLDGTDLPTTVQSSEGRTRYLFKIERNGILRWDISIAKDSFAMTLAVEGRLTLPPGSIEIIFPFDLSFTSVTVLPSLWRSDGRVQAPLVISAPDFGQMLLKATPADGLTGRFEANRLPPRADLVLELPQLGESQDFTLHFTPVRLDAPEGFEDKTTWRLIRRGWFNSFQTQARWGDQEDIHHANGYPGILSGNITGDLDSISLIFYTDPVLWTPQVAEGISVAQLARQLVEFWLEKRTHSNNEVIGYTDYVNFLDSNPNVLIAAWDYVEATGDLAWLEKWIRRLEGVADFSALRDQDRDGLVEATQSGNAGTFGLPLRSSNWFDAVNYGHKDAYSNALIYHGWRCLADLEGRLHRETRHARYTQLAVRLKEAYARQLYNPATGWIACWRSADGKLHDYASPIINGMAVEYGLVDRDHGQKILDRVWAKMRAVGFTRFDLGVPSTLEPIPKWDYMPAPGRGAPAREDGTDTFQHYHNGGISPGHTLHFLVANYLAGNEAQADEMLQGMLKRQQDGLFQHGLLTSYPNGANKTTWNGSRCGGEGYQADVYYFLQAVLLREPGFRKRFYKALLLAD